MSSRGHLLTHASPSLGSLLCLLLLASPALHAEIRSASPPAGYERVVLQGEANSTVSIPMMQPTHSVGRVTAITTDSLTLSGVEWMPDALASEDGHSRFYAEFRSGALAGLFFPVLSNSTDNLQLETLGRDLLAHPLGTVQVDAYVGTELVQSGDVVAIRPFWKIHDLFGGNGQATLLDGFTDFAAFASKMPGDRLYFPDTASVGEGKAPAAVLGWIDGAGWRSEVDATQDQGGYTLAPATVFIASRVNPDQLELFVIGHVRRDRAAMEFLGGDGQQGNIVYFANPFSHPIELNASALNASFIQLSPDPLTRKDELQVPGTFGMPMEQEPLERFILLNSGWSPVGTANQTLSLQPGAGYLLHFREDSPGGFWLQYPNY